MELFLILKAKNNHFIDIQTKGPYRFWHHWHGFIGFEQGTLMIDKVRYQLPLGVIGKLGNSIVGKQLTKIFSHRKKMISKLFS